MKPGILRPTSSSPRDPEPERPQRPASGPSPSGHQALRPLHAMRPAAAADTGDAPFVGRVAILEALGGSLLLDTGRRGGGAIVHGTPGSGKTSLARRLTRQAFAAGMPTLWIGGRTPEQAPAASATGGRCLVVLDDAERASPSTLELLVKIARGPRAASVLVLCRGTGRQLAPVLRRCLEEVERVRRCETVCLRGLDRDDARRLLAAVAGSAPSADAVDVLHARSAGDPFLLTELGRLLGGHGVAAALTEIPRPIRAAVEARIASLPAVAQRSAELATAFSGAFPFEWLLAAVRASENRLLDAVHDLENVGVLAPAAPGRFTFFAPIVLATIGSWSVGNARQRLHRGVAESLERLASPRRAAAAAEIARQYRASSQLPGADRGAAYALQAAELARLDAQPVLAAEMVEATIELVGEVDLPLRAALAAALARARAATLVVHDAVSTLVEAITALQAARADAAAIVDLTADVSALLGTPLTWLRSAAVEHALRTRDPLDGEHEARLAAVRRPLRWETDRRLMIARVDRCDPALIDLLARGSGVDLVLAVSAAGLPKAQRVRSWLQLIAKIDDPNMRLAGMRAIALQSFTVLVEPTFAEVVADTLDDHGIRAGIGNGRALAHLLRSVASGRAGSPHAALALADEAHHHLAGPATLVQPALTTLLGLLAEQHLDPDWERLATRAWGVATAVASPSCYSLALAAFAALARARSGDARRARLCLRDVIPALERSGAHDPSANAALGLAVEAIAELGDRQLAALLEPSAARLIADGAGDFYMTQHDLTRARLEVLLGRHEQADANFDRARVALDAAGERQIRARVDEDQQIARRLSPSPQ